MFWQISQTGDPRAAKIINYKKDGHREGYPNWHHTLVLEMECQLKQTFFGAHLIPNHDLPIAVAEGAKAAIIMSLIRPEYIWISAESKGGLSKSKCESIVEYNVTLFPDAGCYDLWKIKGDSYGFNTTKEVELLMEKGYIEDSDDITNYYLNWPEFRDTLKPKKIKKIDPELNAFVIILIEGINKRCKREFESLFTPKKTDKHNQFTAETIQLKIINIKMVNLVIQLDEKKVY